MKTQGFTTLPILALSIILIILIVGATYWTLNKSDETKLSTQDRPTDWVTYTNNIYGYSINYPKDESVIDPAKNEAWEYSETDYGTAFGPKSSRLGGYRWTLTVKRNSEYNIESLIANIGKQFNDRKESRESITINNIPATLVTVTTDTVNNWVTKSIFIETDGTLYKIENGAIDSAEFETFYNSFKLINATSTNSTAGEISVILYHFDGQNYVNQTKRLSTGNNKENATLELLFDLYLPKISNYYRGIDIKNEVATVNFTPEAREYLGLAVSGISAEYTNSIKKTLLQFDTIKKVQYSIDGKIITDWDA